MDWGLGMEQGEVAQAIPSNPTMVRERGAVPVIPPRWNRKTPREYDARLYKERHLVAMGAQAAIVKP